MSLQQELLHLQVSATLFDTFLIFIEQHPLS
jgi:hypothetical protein